MERLECTKAPSANASSSSSTRPQIISLETPILTHFYAKVMFTKHKQISTVSVKYLDGLQTKFFLAWRGFMVRTPRGANVHSQPLDDFPGGVSLPQLVLLTQNCEIKISSPGIHIHMLRQKSRTVSPKISKTTGDRVSPVLQGTLCPPSFSHGILVDTWPPRIKATFPTFPAARCGDEIKFWPLGCERKSY